MTSHRMVRRGGWFAADTAVVLGKATIGEGSSVWYGAVIRADLAPIRIGRTTNIQDGCVLHCDPGKDMTIGDRVTVGHLAMIHASAVGDDVLVGIGSILLGGAKIGPGSVIGAGALVREDQTIPERSIVVGVPGRIIGTATEAMVRENAARAERYFKLALEHLARR